MVYVQSSSIVGLDAVTGELRWVYIPYRTFTTYYSVVYGDGRLFLYLSKPLQEPGHS